MSKTLYQKTSKGEIQVWEIRTEGSQIITTYGLKDGKMQTATKTAKAKNVGRANETTPEEQAILEAESMYKKKMDKGYFPTEEEAQNNMVLLPMLAVDWFKHSKKYTEDDRFAVQPKLDGVRCLARWTPNGTELISRGNKRYNIPHVIEEFDVLFETDMVDKSMVFDGELYCHELSFQDISGACKKVQDSTYQLKFHMYDVITDFPYSKRMSTIECLKLTQHDFKHIELVETIECRVSQFDTFHSWFVDRGYEGMMIRHPDLPYKIGKRSSLLLKYKKFEDAEFEVVDVLSGSGKFENKAIFVCKMDDGSDRVFNVTPEGTDEDREAYLTNGDKYIGKMLTVTFFGRSTEDIPRFPVGKGFRIEEDLG